MDTQPRKRQRVSAYAELEQICNPVQLLINKGVWWKEMDKDTVTQAIQLCLQDDDWQQMAPLYCLFDV
jgi:hypothetical protein